MQGRGRRPRGAGGDLQLGGQSAAAGGCPGAWVPSERCCGHAWPCRRPSCAVLYPLPLCRAAAVPTGPAARWPPRCWLPPRPLLHARRRWWPPWLCCRCSGRRPPACAPVLLAEGVDTAGAEGAWHVMVRRRAGAAGAAAACAAAPGRGMRPCMGFRGRPWAAFHSHLFLATLLALGQTLVLQAGGGSTAGVACGQPCAGRAPRAPRGSGRPPHTARQRQQQRLLHLH